MATSRKKKRFTLQFELGLGGLLSIGIVVFCVFLWMFLFGVWTGQTLLEPSGEEKESLTALASKLWEQKRGGGVQVSEPISEKKEKEPLREVKVEQEPAHFSLQTAAFRDQDRALQVVLQWRARDYESFYLAPEPDGTFYRVFAGVFDTMEEAKKMAAKFEEQGKDKYFITLIPDSEKRYP